VAFNLGDRDPGSLSTALGQATADKLAREETPVAFGYDKGTPTRFAGTELARRIGGAGDFWRMANDKRDKDAQGYLQEWTRQFTAGMFSPFAEQPPAQGVA
jgi:hypothetical protein